VIFLLLLFFFANFDKIFDDFTLHFSHLQENFKQANENLFWFYITQYRYSNIKKRVLNEFAEHEHTLLIYLNELAGFQLSLSGSFAFHAGVWLATDK
jgi:hypothetical protein